MSNDLISLTAATSTSVFRMLVFYIGNKKIDQKLKYKYTIGMHIYIYLYIYIYIYILEYKLPSRYSEGQF